jgi:membrane protein
VETDDVPSPSGVIHRLQATVAWRAWQRYGKARGGVLAGGMAYVAFFSLLPALALGFTVFGLTLGHHADLQDKVIKAVNDSVGTVVITPTGGTGGVVSIDTLTGSSQLTVVGIVGLIGFLLTGLGWLDALREGIRAMFGQPTLEGNIVKTKARDLLVLTSIGLVLLASAIAGIAVNAATGGLLDLVGLDGSLIGSLVVGGVSTLLLLGVDILVFLLLFRLLSGVRVPNEDLWDAALFGGVGLGILKLLSSVLLKSAHNNKFLATAGVFIALLVWLNLVSRLTLVAASWGATVAIDRGHLVADLVLPGAADATGRKRVSGSGAGAGVSVGKAGVGVPPARSGTTAAGSGVRGAGGPAVGAGVAARGASEPLRPSRPGGPAPAVPFDPVVSPRSADRISVAAGAVLGAAGLYALKTAAGAVRSAVDAARHSD